MRTNASHTDGAAGQTAVRLAFERLGWGPVDNDRHDFGIDLFVQARDEHREELGLLVGVQVKARRGLAQQVRHDPKAGRPGWWWRDTDRRHVDQWLRAAYSVFLVLHDTDGGESYWVHITPDVVMSTGRGAKVFVPREHRHDDSCTQALLRAARSAAAVRGWEGSAWGAGDRIGEAHRWRHALVAPRLVAPHPNRGVDVLTPVEAVALLSQARLRDLSHALERSTDAPSVEEASTHPDWPWRFVGAFHDRLLTGDPGRLRSLLEEAPSVAQRAASAVATAATYVEDGRPEEAEAVLRPLLVDEGLHEIDRSWVRMQSARARTEYGEIEEARGLASTAMSEAANHPDDVTAGAIRAAAASLIYRTANRVDVSVRDVIRSGDTVVGWWRSQTLARGLTAHLQATLRDWTRDPRTTYHPEDPVDGPLFTTMLTTSAAGDQDAWQHYATLLAASRATTLDRGAEPSAAARVLTDLRLAGGTEELKLVAQRLLDDGPCQAVAQAAADVVVGASSATTTASDLALLRLAGDVLDETAATSHVTAVLDQLDDDSALRQRARPAWHLRRALVEALAGVVPCASPDAQTRVADHVVQLPTVEDAFLGRCWDDVVRALPERLWTRQRTETLVRAAHASPLGTTVLGLLARHDEAVRRRLEEDAVAGDEDALVAFGSVVDLTPHSAEQLIARLADRVRGVVNSARTGRFTHGMDVVHALALLNRWHPEFATWGPVAAALSDPTVAASDKYRTLRYLTEAVPDLNPAARDALASAAAEAAATTVSSKADQGMFTGEPADVAGAALTLQHALAAAAEGGPVPAETAVGLLLRRAGEGRLADVARLSRGLDGDVAAVLLAVLAVDTDPRTRTAAVCQLVRLRAGGDRSTVVSVALRQSANDPGREVPLGLARALRSLMVGDDLAGELRLSLTRHSSHRVRTAANEA